jgi:nucleotide-binding universal stress UspA family protein
MKRLLVPTDFADASRIAVGHALELSDAVGAELLLLHVVGEAMLGSPQLAGIREAFTLTIDQAGTAFSYEGPHPADHQALCAEAEWKLAALPPPLDSDRLRTRVVVGKVADEILRVAVEERINLIIMGIQGRKGWRHMHLDSVSDKVIQHASIPVMTLWLLRSTPADHRRARHMGLDRLRRKESSNRERLKASAAVRALLGAQQLLSRWGDVTITRPPAALISRGRPPSTTSPT